MLDRQFIKVDPTVYVMQYKKGNLVREGNGLSFFYFAPTTSLVSVPVASTDSQFIFKEVTSDFQEITIQGQVVYRVADPKRLSQMVNFALDVQNQKNLSDDPEKSFARIINQVQVLLRAELQVLPLRELVKSFDGLVKRSGWP